MRFCILFFIAFFNLGVKAQTSVDSISIYFDLKKYDKAISFASRHGNYIELINYGINLYLSQDYEKALPFLKKGLEMGKNSISDDNKILIQNAVSHSYNEKSDFKNAIVYRELALKIQENKYGMNDPNYLKSLNNLAYLYNLNGEYSKAESAYVKVLETRKAVLGERNPDYALSISNLACLYDDVGKYNLSEPLHFKALKIRKEILDEKHPDYLISLNNLANSYNLQGKYLQAESLFEKVLKIRKETLGENNLDYVLSLNNLATLYKNQGKYLQAEQLYLESLKIKKEILGEKNSDYALSLNNLANLYDVKDQYDKAEKLYIESLTIRKEILGEKHPEYLESLNNLAGLYQAQDKYLEAEELYKKVLGIRKDVLGERHPDYATSLDMLAGLYRDEKKFSNADPLFIKALEIRKEVLGEKHPDYVISLENLALSYLLQDKYFQAEDLFLKSLKIRKEILGENHPDYITNLFELGHLYRITESNDKSAVYFEKYLKSNYERIIEDIYSLSEKELINYVALYKVNLFSPLSFLNKFPTSYPEININTYKNELLVKNLSIRNRELIRKSIQKSDNKSLKDKYEQFLTNKREIKKIQESSLDKRPDNFEILVKETGQIENELIKESYKLIDYKKVMTLSWTDVKSKLKDDEISIDLVSFESPGNDVLFSAFIIEKNFKTPKFIPLFKEKELDSLLKRNKNEKDNNSIDKQYKDNDISDLFLKPLKKELDGITTIYLSPAGLGHQIDFSALPVSETQTLGEKYKLHILSSPAELVDYKVATLDKKSNLELLLYGGIDYDKSEINNNLNTKPVENNSNFEFVTLATRSGISKWDFLVGTQKEVGQINDKSQQNGFVSTIINGRLATEESIKKLDGKTNPYVLHLATHGFFFPDPKQELQEEKLQLFSEKNKSKIYKTSDDPMMRSGLLFAGANKYWNKTNENIATEDGILTASEISNLDLSACQLVVLSACETGLGEVKGSEGVFGLQRAFKMAGVKNIIMSLWKVPDAQTAELFDIFYSECFAGKTIHEAFQSAQTKMKAKYSPYYWAGFVLLE